MLNHIQKYLQNPQRGVSFNKPSHTNKCGMTKLDFNHKLIVFMSYSMFWYFGLSGVRSLSASPLNAEMHEIVGSFHTTIEKDK